MRQTRRLSRENLGSELVSGKEGKSRDTLRAEVTKLVTHYMGERREGKNCVAFFSAMGFTGAAMSGQEAGGDAPQTHPSVHGDPGHQEMCCEQWLGPPVQMFLYLTPVPLLWWAGGWTCSLRRSPPGRDCAHCGFLHKRQSFLHRKDFHSLSQFI